MIRKQIYLQPQQDKAVKKLASKEGVSEAEYLRRLIDVHLAEVVRRRERLEAWRQVNAFVGQLVAKGPLPGGRTWRREDLYDRPNRPTR